MVSTTIGAPLALGLMLHVGKGNDSHLLLTLFSVWVLVPFAMLLSAYARSKAWAATMRTTLRRLMLGVPVITIAVYANVAFGPLSARNAVIFVLSPPLASLFIVSSLLITLLTGRARTHGRTREPRLDGVDPRR